MNHPDYVERIEGNMQWRFANKVLILVSEPNLILAMGELSTKKTVASPESLGRVGVINNRIGEWFKK